MRNRRMLSLFLSSTPWLWLIGCSSGPPDVPAGAPSESVTSNSVALSASDSGGEDLDSPPPEYVRVPGGFVHPSCVHEVPNGARIEETGDVFDASGNLVTHIGKCNHPGVKGNLAKTSMGT